MRAFGNQPFDPRLAARAIALYVAGPRRRRSPLCLLNADLSALPPIQMHYGTREVMRADAEQFAARVVAAGGHCDTRIWPELMHGYWIWPRDGGLTSLQVAGHFLRAIDRRSQHRVNALRAWPTFATDWPRHEYCAHRGMVDVRATRRGGAGFPGLAALRRVRRTARPRRQPATATRRRSPTNAARSASANSTQDVQRVGPWRWRPREFGPARWSPHCIATAGTSMATVSGGEQTRRPVGADEQRLRRPATGGRRCARTGQLHSRRRRIRELLDRAAVGHAADRRRPARRADRRAGRPRRCPHRRSRAVWCC